MSLLNWTRPEGSCGLCAQRPTTPALLELSPVHLGGPCSVLSADSTLCGWEGQGDQELLREGAESV